MTTPRPSLPICGSSRSNSAISSASPKNPERFERSHLGARLLSSEIRNPTKFEIADSKMPDELTDHGFSTFYSGLTSTPNVHLPQLGEPDRLCRNGGESLFFPVAVVVGFHGARRQSLCWHFNVSRRADVFGFRLGDGWDRCVAAPSSNCESGGAICAYTNRPYSPARPQDFWSIRI